MQTIDSAPRHSAIYGHGRQALLRPDRRLMAFIHRTMEALIERGGRLSIMLEEDIDAPNGNAREHPLIEAALAIDDSDSLQLRKAAKSSVDHLKEADYHHHWTVMDDWAFRLEIDIEVLNIR